MWQSCAETQWLRSLNPTTISFDEGLWAIEGHWHHNEKMVLYVEILLPKDDQEAGTLILRRHLNHSSNAIPAFLLDTYSWDQYQNALPHLTAVKF